MAEKPPDNTLQTLVLRVEEMRDALTTLESRLMERCPLHERQIQELNLIVHGPPGNGRHPGLISRMGKVEDVIKRLERVRGWLWGIAGTALGGAAVIALDRIFN